MGKRIQSTLEGGGGMSEPGYHKKYRELKGRQSRQMGDGRHHAELPYLPSQRDLVNFSLYSSDL